MQAHWREFADTAQLRSLESTAARVPRITATSTAPAEHVCLPKKIAQFQQLTVFPLGLRNIKKPLIWIIVVIVLVIGSLLGYVYIFDGPRVGREPNNPKAKLDVSVAASFGNVQNNLKKASINDAAGEDLTVTSSTETNLVAQQKGLNVTSNSGGKHELNAGEFKGPDNPQANARLEMDSNVPLTGISEQANGVSH